MLSIKCRLWKAVQAPRFTRCRRTVVDPTVRMRKTWWSPVRSKHGAWKLGKKLHLGFIPETLVSDALRGLEVPSGVLELGGMCTQEQNQRPLDSWSGLWPRPDGIQTSSLRALLQTFTYFCNLIPSWKKQNLPDLLIHWLHKQILQWPLGKNKMAII